MDNLNKRAISEVIHILNHTDKEITEKIPKKFIDFLFENADDNYKPDINLYDDNWENEIDEDTKVLLAIIYRDYIVSETERLELLEEERQEKQKQEELLREKYNLDNIFKNKETKEEKEDNSIVMIEQKKSIFTKIKNWLKQIFNK